MSFGSPRMLVAVLLVPVIVGGYVSVQRRRARRAARLAAEGLVATTSGFGRRRHVPFALFAAALTVMAVGLARPAMTQGVPRLEGTVILAFDVSDSMRADDVEPSRIDAARKAARSFVRRQPSSVRIGVVAFGDGAVVVQRPTSEPSEVEDAIERLSVQGGTSLGQGLFVALGSIAGRPLALGEDALNGDTDGVDIGYYGSSEVVLLSDGENTTGPDPLAVAELASSAGVRVHTVGLGTPEGTVLELGGFSVATAMDEDLLERVAGITDGAYYPAEDTRALDRIYRSIDLDLTTRAERTEVTALLAALATLLLLAGSLLSVLWFARVV